MCQLVSLLAGMAHLELPSIGRRLAIARQQETMATIGWRGKKSITISWLRIPSFIPFLVTEREKKRQKHK